MTANFDVMNQRQQTFLKYSVEGYLATAQPVSSKFLAEKNKLPFSTATIRTEMAYLEEEGFMYQPHTSAGRIPSIAGLRFYVDHLIAPLMPSRSEMKRFASIFSSQGLKGIARESAALCESACIVSHGTSEFYYTGFSQLFAQPEFMDAERIHALGEIIDHIETILPEIAEEMKGDPKVYLGKDNPLGTECAAIFISNRSPKKTIIGFLSPLRTNYARSIGTLVSVSHYLPES